MKYKEVIDRCIEKYGLVWDKNIQNLVYNSLKSKFRTKLSVVRTLKECGYSYKYDYQCEDNWKPIIIEKQKTIEQKTIDVGNYIELGKGHGKVRLQTLEIERIVAKSFFNGKLTYSNVNRLSYNQEYADLYFTNGLKLKTKQSTKRNANISVGEKVQVIYEVFSGSNGTEGEAKIIYGTDYKFNYQRLEEVGYEDAKIDFEELNKLKWDNEVGRFKTDLKSLYGYRYIKSNVLFKLINLPIVDKEELKKSLASVLIDEIVLEEEIYGEPSVYKGKSVYDGAKKNDILETARKIMEDKFGLSDIDYESAYNDVKFRFKPLRGRGSKVFHHRFED